MGPVGLGVQPSVPAASQAPAAQLGISDPAMYDKWRQVAWRVAAELGREAELPPLGPGSRAKLLDGHPLAASDPRLEALRHPWAAPWPGQILVGLAQQRMLAPEVVLWEAGHTQAQSWLRPVLPWVEPDDLWSAERHCGTGDLLRGLAARGGCCVVRQHGPLQGSLGGVRQSQGAIDPGEGLRQR